MAADEELDHHDASSDAATTSADDETPSAEESPFRDRPPVSDALAERILCSGTIVMLGQMPWSSNTTMLCDIARPTTGSDRTPSAPGSDPAESDGTEFDRDTDPAEAGESGEEVVLQAIYKPHRGERPLWDFPAGLGPRERAAYELSKALGWGLVPPTVLRDGPFGTGSLQVFVPSRFEEHYFTLQDETQYRPAFERLACFDVVANSTDRKSGHVLLGTDNKIYAIDNGLSFHSEFKLRTVLWDFAGEPIPDQILSDLVEFMQGDPREKYPDLVANLADDEIDAMMDRTRRLVYESRFPTDPSGRRWPWPLV